MRPRRRRFYGYLALAAAVVLVGVVAVRVVWSHMTGSTADAGRQATLTIVLDAHDRQAFAFATRGKGLEGFTLDDDNDPARSDRATFSGLAAGTYTVSERAVPGWALPALTCTTPQTVDLGARSVAVTLGGADDVTCTFTNARTRPLIGATRWDAWNDGRPGRAVEYTLGPAKWRNRLPWFGQVTGPDTVTARADNQATADADLATAADMGIDYFAFVWYGAGPSTGPEDQTMNRGLAYYRSSPARDRVQYTLEVPTALVADPDARATILEYMRDANWVHVDGRPLLFVGLGEAPDRAAYDTLRAESVAQGTGNPYLVYLCLGKYRLTDAATYVDQSGVDAVSAYAAGVSASAGKPYATLAAQTHAAWDAVAATGTPLVPTVMAGWDPRPRIERPPYWGGSGSSWYQAPTPAELGTHVTDALQWARGYGSRAVLAYAWNEYDEGGWLAPTYLPEPERQAAVKAATAARHIPSLSVQSAEFAEGNRGTTNATVKVRLAHPPDKTVTVNYATADATATAGSDYVATNGALTFAPGRDTATFTVRIVGDTTFESDETFSVRLTQPVNAFLGPATGTVTLTNDDDDTKAEATNVFVSDLTPTSATNGYGPVERDMSNGANLAGDGRTITLNGVKYAKGLGVHAASTVVYAVPAGATTFRAEIGVDDESGAGGSVVFQVLVDGVARYTSPTLTGAGATQTVRVNVTGAKTITLTVTDGGDTNASDHADWAAAGFR